MFALSRFVFLLLALCFASLAQADPPARVGRLSVVENGVNLRLDGDEQGGPASINWPISSGARLDTERRGRAEVWIGAVAFRLAGSSQLAFPAVDDRQITVQLLGGTLAISVFDREQSAGVTVLTPEGAVTFEGPGRYRIDLLPEQSELSVQAGQARLGDGRRSFSVSAGQKASLYGGGQLRMEVVSDADAFDNWVAERENAALANDSLRYVSSGMTGYQDLDRHGDWASLPEYGAVWYPRWVAEDWAPYRFGRWVWVAPWGWTWVDEAAWGFAPFHYGRWVHVDGRWGWVPGRYTARPVYAPALVAWNGNPGVGRAGRPDAAWFPLAPREVYVPGFRVSSTYVRQLNSGHVRHPGEIERALQAGARPGYLYQNLPQAVSTVPSGRPHENRPIRALEIPGFDPRRVERASPPQVVPDHSWPGRSFREERREPVVMPQGASGPVLNRPPEPERRSLPMVPAAPLSPPPVRAVEPLHRPPTGQPPAPVIRENPPAMPPGRAVQYPEQALPRPREAQPSAPAPTSLRAPPPPLAQPVPAREMRPAEPPRGGNRDGNPERRRDHGDDRERR